MEDGDVCCDDTILQDEEFCCKTGEVENPEVRNESTGSVGPEEIICDGAKNHKCFAQKICWDSNTDQRVHGEDGGTESSCKDKLTCATAIVHVCNKDRLNNNCQDECLTQTPPPAGCDDGEDGVCGNPSGCDAGSS